MRPAFTKPCSAAVQRLKTLQPTPTAPAASSCSLAELQLAAPMRSHLRQRQLVAIVEEDADSLGVPVAVAAGKALHGGRMGV